MLVTAGFSIEEYVTLGWRANRADIKMTFRSMMGRVVDFAEWMVDIGAPLSRGHSFGLVCRKATN